MKPRVESLSIAPRAKRAYATIAVPAPTRDNVGDFPPVFEHLELFVELWVGLQPDTLHLLHDDDYPCVEQTMTDRKDKVQYYDIAFEYTSPPSRQAIDSVDWKDVQG